MLTTSLSLSLSPSLSLFVDIGWVWFTSLLPWATRGQPCVPYSSSETRDCSMQIKNGVSEGNFQKIDDS